MVAALNINKGGIFDAEVREILPSPILKTQICTLITEPSDTDPSLEYPTTDYH